MFRVRAAWLAAGSLWTQKASNQLQHASALHLAAGGLHNNKLALLLTTVVRSQTANIVSPVATASMAAGVLVETAAMGAPRVHPMLLAMRALSSVAQPPRGSDSATSTSGPASTSSSTATAAGASSGGARVAAVEAGKHEQERFDSLELTDEKISAITDKIPQRPVGVVEGTSWSLLIIAAFGVLAFVLYQFVVSFILTPLAFQCFNHTIDRLKSDPRITVRLGAADEIRAWGSNSPTRVGRQNIPHLVYTDVKGTEHVKLQFYMGGPGGTALVNADMYKDVTGQWAYTYLLAEVYTGASPQPQRVIIVAPKV